ncbi:hypothetical protein TSH100_19945 [Azospirillum sp. TSH100]|uniref:hypothetical protein n=1 Tax=Azospirillum sp. TSH100 TaxID=652764 RepID=UPI000D6106CE|nr:hypothetical protein [Azospirillum sp. TSH100]PWC83833.1 hypothetical protein TSH100_19945 [Azospirillum sp. TSH100]QCG88369.1 hypothetical protein E6C72_11960 [Azospirillum sp. TSH100]
MDGGCGGGACGGGSCGGGASRPSGGSEDLKHTMRMAMVVNGLLGTLLLAAANATQAVTLWAAALLVLNHAAGHAVTLVGLGRRPDRRTRLSMLHGVALAAASVALVVTAGRSIAGMAIPDVSLASLALLLAIGVTVATATLLFAGRRGTLTLRAIWLCARKDVLPLGAGLIGLGASWLLLDGAPDALVGAGIAAVLLPAAWGLLRGSVGGEGMAGR